MAVVRFAGSMVQVFFGVIGLVLCAYLGLWCFAKVHSVFLSDIDYAAVNRRVMAYDAPGARHDMRAAAAAVRDRCGADRHAACAAH